MHTNKSKPFTIPIIFKGVFVPLLEGKRKSSDCSSTAVRAHKLKLYLDNAACSLSLLKTISQTYGPGGKKNTLLSLNM